MTETRQHLPGLPVSRSTYDNHGCRCDDCRAARLTYDRSRSRTRSAYYAERMRLLRRTAAWVRENHPEVWQRLKDEVRSDG